MDFQYQKWETSMTSKLNVRTWKNIFRILKSFLRTLSWYRGLYKCVRLQNRRYGTFGGFSHRRVTFNYIPDIYTMRRRFLEQEHINQNSRPIEENTILGASSPIPELRVNCICLNFELIFETTNSSLKMFQWFLELQIKHLENDFGAFHSMKDSEVHFHYRI